MLVCDVAVLFTKGRLTIKVALLLWAYAPAMKGATARRIEACILPAVWM